MLNALLFIVTVVIWGSTWYAIDFQLGTVAAGVSLTYRYALAAALGFSWCYFAGLALRFPLRAHAHFVLLGAFLFGLNYLSAYQAQFYITSALNAIGFSALVWMNIINARIFLGERTDVRTYIGATFGIVGIVVVFWPSVQSVSLSDEILLGAFFSLLGALLASFGNIISQNMQMKKIPVMQATAWGMLYGGLINGLIAVVQGQAFNFDYSTGYIVSLLFLASFGSFVAFACYLNLIGRIGVQRAGYAAVMIPVVALLLSVTLEGLRIDRYILSGVALAIFGNIVVLARR